MVLIPINIRRGSRPAGTSKMEYFVIIVNSVQVKPFGNEEKCEIHSNFVIKTKRKLTEIGLM